MKIFHHPLCDQVIGAPADMQDGSCESLPILVQDTEHGRFAISFWQPEPEDIAVLNAGGGIALHVRAAGRQHPVVALGTYDPLESATAHIEQGEGRDWTEDFPHENGNYMNNCNACGKQFFGHKRRIHCKACAHPAPVEAQPVSIAEAQRNAAEDVVCARLSALGLTTAPQYGTLAYAKANADFTPPPAASVGSVGDDAEFLKLALAWSEGESASTPWRFREWEALVAYLDARQPPAAALDADELSNFIRSIDGNNKMGAGTLAERIVEWSAAYVQPPAAAEGERDKARDAAVRDRALQEVVAAIHEQGAMTMGIYRKACLHCEDVAEGLRSAPAQQSFQQRVQPWMTACFGPVISGDKQERNHRFLEESLELVQACGCTQSEAHQLVDYVYGRPVGEPQQEVGGVMVTLAALCLASGMDMHQCGETELARIWTKVDAIRAKQAAKPKHSPLPQAAPAQQSDALSDAEIFALTSIGDLLRDQGNYASARVLESIIARISGKGAPT